MYQKYAILLNGYPIFSDLSEFEYFERMEDLSIEFYQTGTPHPDELSTEITQVND
tara:strand:+ start:344 stop:508 length:165 start_codon:yes stop_codon:yes gene_type:complete